MSGYLSANRQPCDDAGDDRDDPAEHERDPDARCVCVEIRRHVDRADGSRDLGRNAGVPIAVSSSRKASIDAAAPDWPLATESVYEASANWATSAVTRTTPMRDPIDDRRLVDGRGRRRQTRAGRWRR